MMNELISFSNGDLFAFQKGKTITEIDLVTENLLGKYIFQVVLCFLKGLI